MSIKKTRKTKIQKEIEQGEKAFDESFNTAPKSFLDEEYNNIIKDNFINIDFTIQTEKTLKTAVETLNIIAIATKEAIAQLSEKSNVSVYGIRIDKDTKNTMVTNNRIVNEGFDAKKGTPIEVTAVTMNTKS